MYYDVIYRMRVASVLCLTHVTRAYVRFKSTTPVNHHLNSAKTKHVII